MFCRFFPRRIVGLDEEIIDIVVIYRPFVYHDSCFALTISFWPRMGRRLCKLVLDELLRVFQVQLLDVFAGNHLGHIFVRWFRALLYYIFVQIFADHGFVGVRFVKLLRLHMLWVIFVRAVAQHLLRRGKGLGKFRAWVINRVLFRGFLFFFLFEKRNALLRGFQRMVRVAKSHLYPGL